MARKKRTAESLNKSLKRSAKRKARRLRNEQTRRVLKAMTAPKRAWANIMMMRGPKFKLRGGGLSENEVVIGTRTGLFGHPTTTYIRLQEEKIVGAVESMEELGPIVTQVGLLTLSSLLAYNPAFGPEGLARALARWAGIDLEALKKQAEEDNAAAAADPTFTGTVDELVKVIETVDEDGDIEVRTVEPPVGEAVPFMDAEGSGDTTPQSSGDADEVAPEELGGEG